MLCLQSPIRQPLRQPARRLKVPPLLKASWHSVHAHVRCLARSQLRCPLRAQAIAHAIFDAQCKTGPSRSLVHTVQSYQGLIRLHQKICFGAGKTAEAFGAAVSESGRAAAASIKQRAQDATIKLRGAGQDLLAGPQVRTNADSLYKLPCRLLASRYQAVATHSS